MRKTVFFYFDFLLKSVFVSKNAEWLYSGDFVTISHIRRNIENYVDSFMKVNVGTKMGLGQIFALDYKSKF